MEILASALPASHVLQWLAAAGQVLQDEVSLSADLAVRATIGYRSGFQGRVSTDLPCVSHEFLQDVVRHTRVLLHKCSSRPTLSEDILDGIATVEAICKELLQLHLEDSTGNKIPWCTTNQILLVLGALATPMDELYSEGVVMGAVRIYDLAVMLGGAASQNQAMEAIRDCCGLSQCPETWVPSLRTVAPRRPNSLLESNPFPNVFGDQLYTETVQERESIGSSEWDNASAASLLHYIYRATISDYSGSSARGKVNWLAVFSLSMDVVDAFAQILCLAGLFEATDDVWGNLEKMLYALCLCWLARRTVVPWLGT
ncbi:hypothetical protein BDV95DRAFT_65227 [Massariosphaeria phaeospora]|uniref:Uncharacterized protein n=1 Tax=Massariosphaeria phaeospora TaxID=100035 RepID=A0A7C8MJ94_9PLEO|nr:hypothetical protein BDV95DRAFT_65227 [Massariosphaeria phaeospora]